MHLNPFNLILVFRTFFRYRFTFNTKVSLIPLTVLNLLNLLYNGKVWRFNRIQEVILTVGKHLVRSPK